MSEQQVAKQEIIKRIVNRFLGWKIPENFNPDCGISFKQFSDYDHPKFGRQKSEPIGTNLFSADQAKQMMEHCLADELKRCYTTSPSIDALIAEIDGLPHYSQLGSEAVLQTLNKYRSKK